MRSVSTLQRKAPNSKKKKAQAKPGRGRRLQHSCPAPVTTHRSPPTSPPLPAGPRRPGSPRCSRAEAHGATRHLQAGRWRKARGGGGRGWETGRQAGESFATTPTSSRWRWQRGEHEPGQRPAEDPRGRDRGQRREVTQTQAPADRDPEALPSAGNDVGQFWGVTVRATSQSSRCRPRPFKLVPPPCTPRLRSSTAAARGVGLALQLRPAPGFDALVKYHSDCTVPGR